ncbi:MAG: hypothetical protein IJ009_05105 [Clostridia bacterium]|nr:hypothetical protein [Clostridia bacterium]
MNRKYVLSAVLALLALVYLFSFFTGVLSDCAPDAHDCRGDDCFICLCLSLAEHAVAVIAVFAALPLSSLCFKNKTYREAECDFVLATPVRLKVKLSD